MIKTFTRCLIIISLLCSSTTHAQQILFSENFDAIPGYNIPNWPQNVGAWQAGPPYMLGSYCFTPPGDNPLSPNKAIGFCDEHINLNTGICNMDKTLPDVFIYTPPVNYSSGIWLQYDSYFLKAVVNGQTEKAEILASGDDGLSWNVVGLVPPSNGGFTTFFAPAPYYVNATSLRFGFRYSDIGQMMRGWLVDNVKIFIPPQKDLALTKLVPDDSLLRYATINQSLLLGGTVTNMGIDTVKSFVLKYQETNGAVATDSISNVLIPPFKQYDFTHSIPYTVTALGIHKIKVWVEFPGDSNPSNDQLTTDVRGSSFKPVKKLAVEVGTHVLHSWCPRSLYYMDSLQHMAIMQDDDVSIIAVHNATDPMEDLPYQTFIYNLNQYFLPYFLFDRRINAEPDSFFATFNHEKKYFGFADLEMNTTLDGNQFTVVTTVKPAIDLSGDMRLALVITENNVTGTTGSYNQANIFAGGILGPMGGYENLPNPVPAADMHYNFVARNIFPQPDGQPGYLPPTMLHGNSYDVTFNTWLDASWDKSMLQAIVLLIRNDDSTILNSNHTVAPLKVAGISSAFNMINLFPNPADDITRLRYDLKDAQEVRIMLSDLSGKLLYQSVPAMMQAGTHETTIPVNRLSTGIYMVTVSTKAGKETLKLEVVH